MKRFNETDQLPAAPGLLRLRLAMTAAARHCEARSAEAIQTFVRVRYDSNLEIAELVARRRRMAQPVIDGFA